MKLAGILLLGFLSQTSVIKEHKTITFSGKEIEFKSILKTIKCQTNVGFFYDASLLKEAKPISVEYQLGKSFEWNFWKPSAIMDPGKQYCYHIQKAYSNPSSSEGSIL